MSNTSFSESIAKDAALTWFRELICAIGHEPRMALGETAAERDSFNDVVLMGGLREAVRFLYPAIAEGTCPTA